MLDKEKISIILFAGKIKKGYIMYYTDENSKTADFNRRLSEVSERVVELENKVLEHRVALSNNALVDDVLREYELELDKAVDLQMKMRKAAQEMVFGR